MLDKPSTTAPAFPPCHQGFEVVRLKDKLGTRQLPTAELLLTGIRGLKVRLRGLQKPSLTCRARACLLCALAHLTCMATTLWQGAQCACAA